MSVAASRQSAAEQMILLRSAETQLRKIILKKHPIVIAIDGTSASGKSTNSKLVAKALDYAYVDTGAMYRTLGVALPAKARGHPRRQGRRHHLPQMENVL